MIVAKLREVLLRYHVGTIMTVSFLCFSCTKDKALNEAHLKANKTLAGLGGDAAEFTAADIFKGVFLADGQVADLLPELAEFKVNNFITLKI